jgi:hypothetical protein
MYSFTIFYNNSELQWPEKMLLKSSYLCNSVYCIAIRSASGSRVAYIVPESAAFFRAEDEGKNDCGGGNFNAQTVLLLSPEGNV